MKSILKISLMLFVFGLLTSCEEEDKIGDSILDTSQVELNELDTWIYDTFTVPYNLKVTYLYDDNEVDPSDYLTPTKTEVVKPFMEAYYSLFLHAFEEAVDPEFIKTYSAKILVLVGSYNYNSDGTRHLGQAEGGSKVTLFEMNTYLDVVETAEEDSDSRERFKRFFHTVHHEFCHILQQTKNYDQETYSQITPDYRSDWTNLDEDEALNAGFISPYSAADVNEDMAEIVGTMLTNSPEEFDAILQSPDNDEAIEALQTKVDLIVDYYKSAWGIDLYELQEDISTRMEEYIDNYND